MSTLAIILAILLAPFIAFALFWAGGWMYIGLIYLLEKLQGRDF